MHEQNWQAPEWWYREKSPTNDNAYFENMGRVIFQAGLNWQVIDKKWPTIKKAFANFDINKVACFTDADVERLMKDAGIVRNKGKIQATIQNAIRFKAIEKLFGSFQAYLDSLDKSNNYANAVKDLISKFKWLGPSSASLFLYTVGEKISPWD
ncbi:MAG: DNA-3-methyladenine glycosylase I [Candidatus Bathyarchaeia archaeon]|jgi:3-methyladenine DNA glycosylase Tag